MVEKIPLRKIITRLDFPAILSFGNPLLDIYVILKNDDLLKKHNLKIDGETELSEKKMQELIADLPPELVNIITAIKVCIIKYNFLKNFFISNTLCLPRTCLIFFCFIEKIFYM